MSNLVGIVFNVEFSLVIGMIISFALGFLLILIKVPTTEYSKKIANTKNCIAICNLVASALFFLTLRYSGMEDYDAFASLMMFVITVMASVVLSYSLITLLEPKAYNTDKFILNIGVVIVMTYILAKSFWWDSREGRIAVVVVSLVLFVFQCIVQIIKFSRVYATSVKKLEQYYDTDEDSKLRWVRFCYIIMMLTQMFVLVYLLLPQGMMKIYIAFYSLFLLYFTANFISFLGSHKLVLDAFAYKTLSGQDLIDMINSRKDKKAGRKPVEGDINEAEFRRLDIAVDKWVKEKKFRKYDQSREEIAQELKTTKEALHMYFMTKVGVDFRTWRTQLRIDEAKILLLERKNVSVNVIGEMAGFSDRANFYRQFVKFVGCSPKEWRESKGKPNKN